MVVFFCFVLSFVWREFACMPPIPIEDEPVFVVHAIGDKVLTCHRSHHVASRFVGFI